MSVPGGRLRSRLRLWWGFVLVLLLGLYLATLGGRMLVGGVVMTVAFVLAAGLRAFLPAEVVGGLQIRSRTTDVITYLVVAAVVLGAVLAVDLGPVRR